MSSIDVKLDKILMFLTPREKTCATCDWYNHEHEMCSKWKMKPPAKTIVVGCDDWWYDDIPFK